MFANPPLSLKLRKVFFVALLVLICAILVYWLTQENKLWVVPEEYKSLKNPLPASPSNLNAAREIYFDECVQCHGERGQGDGPQANSFKNRLTQDQRWQLVLLVRSFSQPASSAGTPAAPTPSKMPAEK